MTSAGPADEFVHDLHIGEVAFVDEAEVGSFGFSFLYDWLSSGVVSESEQVNIGLSSLDDYFGKDGLGNLLSILHSVCQLCSSLYVVFLQVVEDVCE